MFGWAPIGTDMIPEMMELMDFKMEEIDETTLAETYKLLEVGPPTPSMEEHIKEMAERFKAREESRKEN